MTHYNLIASNKRKSWLVVALFMAFIVGVSYAMAYGFGFSLDWVFYALILSGILAFGSYWFSDSFILAVSRARPATRQEFFDFYTVTENLVMGERMPMPRLYVIEDEAMNAFATGRDPQHAVVCATTGILARLNRSELEGVIAHELSHVENYDTRLMAIVAILVGSVALLSDLMLRMTMFGGGRRGRDREGEGNQLQIIFLVIAIFLAILSPFIAQLIQLAISRRREFLADAAGAGITKNPEGLARALEKISQDQLPLKEANKATAHLYFENPLKNQKGSASWFANMFNTHPPVADRIKALRSL